MGKRKLLLCDDELSYAEDIKKVIDDLYPDLNLNHKVIFDYLFKSSYMPV